MTAPEPIRLLYAEDNPRDADQAREALAAEEGAFVVEVVGTGQACLDRLRAEEFDVLLLDNRLPDMDGLDVLRALIHQESRLPVVLVTGVGDEELVVRALRLGVADYVQKRAGHLDLLPGALRGAVTAHRRRSRTGRLPAEVLRRVLYVEHFADDAELALRHFHEEAPQLLVDVVNSCAEALKRLAGEHAYDLVLLDLRMPEMSGLDFVVEARRLAVPLPAFVMVTGMGDEPAAIAALKLGAADYVVKREGYLGRLVHIIEHTIERERLVASNVQLRAEIAARTQVEADLRASEQRFNLAFHLSPVATMITTMEGRYVDVNAAFCDLVGCQRDALIGEQVGVLGNANARLREETIVAADQRAGTLHGIEHTIHRTDGTPRHVLFSTTVIELRGEPHRLSTLQDVTDRWRAEEEVRALNQALEQRIAERTVELRASNQELEAFAYTVSHDLRAPLRTVDGYVNILREQYGSQLDDEGQRICGVISEGAKQLGRLIDDLLEYSRMGRTALQRMPLDLSALVQAAFADVADPATRERITFQVADLPTVDADAIMLRKVLLNLLGNAVKFTAKRPEAVIEVGWRPAQADEPSPGQAVFYVRDNGAGFDMRYVAKLFGLFQRLHPSSEFEGTGVGLAIVHRAIQRHGGRVWAEGAPGQGATVYFTLGPGA